MKIIIDECLPKRLMRYLPGHEVTTVPLAGLASYSNGKLLAAIDQKFDIFITIDGNFTSQQNLEGKRLIVIVIRAVSNRIEDLIHLAPKLLKTIESGDGTILYV